MLHFIQCYEIICNYYTMSQTLYYTYGQGSLLLGVSTLRGIGHSRQGCVSSTIDYPQPCVHLAVPICVIHQPDSAPYIQPNDPFCVSEYISQQENRFLFLANNCGGGFSFAFCLRRILMGVTPDPNVCSYIPRRVSFTLLHTR